MDVIDEVRAAIARRGAAMVAGHVDGIAELLDDRCIYTHSSGLSDTKATYVEALRKQEYTYHSVDMVAVDHSILLPEVVILNSVMKVSMTVKSSGQSISREIKVTEMWIRGTVGEWKLLVSHSTNKS
jgi:ketosteroid isomerase-like protein